MLPKKKRLDLKREFFQIKRNGKLIKGRFFNFLFQKQQPSGDFQSQAFAFVISKKIDKRASERNKIKRLLSEAVRSFLPQVKLGVKGVFLAKKEILGKDFAEIKKEIEAIFKEENLLG
jgi:ribonuclease P protein component